MKLNRATVEDYESIIAFYDDVTDRTSEMELYARWQKGKHPTHGGIKAYIEEESMYLYKKNDVIIGAMAVTMYQGEDYHNIEWSQQVLDNEVTVIHILAVSPDCQGKGIGSEMIREAICLAQTNGMKAIRLDALASNTPAHKIYKALGFEYRGQQHLYAENTGWTDFYFFEYINHTIYERNNCYMKHEIIELHDVQIIGMAKKIAFNEAKEECPKFWGEYVEKIIKPVVFEKQAPNTFQKAAIDNGVGEFGLCTCDIPNHNCATCWEANFGACKNKTFTYVIGGIYKGGDVPEGMQLFPIHSGKWLKMHFEGGMKAFQEQYTKFHKEWVPAHPEYTWATNSCCMEWYQGTDIQSPDYQCGVMMPLE